jgi:hypothetical protein
MRLWDQKIYRHDQIFPLLHSTAFNLFHTMTAYLNFVLMLSSNLCISLSSGLIPLIFPNTNFYALFILCAMLPDHLHPFLC